MLYSKAARELDSHDMARMNVGKKFWYVTLDAVPDTAGYKAVLAKYLENLEARIHDGVGLFLTGPMRGGKTSASVVVAKHLVSHGGTAYFIRADGLQSAFMEHQRFDEDYSVVDRMRDVDLLVIDDMWQEYAKEFGGSAVEKLVRWRHDMQKALVVTTNMTVKEFEAKYGPGVRKVLGGMCITVAVDCPEWYRAEVDKMRSLA